MTITVYTFRGPKGNPYTGEYATQDYQEAKDHAREYGYLVVANEYEWADSEDLDDFTGDDATDDTTDQEG